MKLSTIYGKAEEIFLVISMLMIVLLIFGQAFSRYFLGSGIVWGEELARYLHVGQVWLGSSLVVREGGHIRVTFMRDLFSQRVRKYIDITASIIFFALTTFIAISGTKFIMQLFETGQKSPSMGVLLAIPYMVIPLGGLLMSIRLIQQIIKLYKGSNDAVEGVKE